ncbi:hypothetical protein QBC32DRAFT_383814 [Pseudoneurospora amorphoporcata]|uniref:Uncharacterized protein n=1 Tax=Pseudoneurospora amorphoporcata TaxID=241081 RepID=A0AAN6P2V6_9PEZI|nr:hypothetical protein QBC32DRAFT_383814 [Pseudoneurospora amorphoporcata]
MPRFTTGDIACLKDFNWKGRTDEERSVLTALNPGHDMGRASAHPCIVLKTDRRYALVTTVSAHGSGPYDQWRSPWTRGGHYKKRPDRYRSFEGTARFNPERPYLRLSKGAWPKPRGSWVNVENVLLVPVWFLGVFYKAQGYDENPYIPHMARESLDDLLWQIIEDNWQWSRLLRRFEELRGVKPFPPPSPATPVSPPPRAPAKSSPPPQAPTKVSPPPPGASTKVTPPPPAPSWADVAKGKKR